LDQGDFYVYLYRDPKANNEVVYIGSGKGRRAWSHLGYQSNSPLEVLIQKRRAQGVIMEPEIKQYFINRISAYLHESELILQYGLKEQGGTLLNKVFGYGTFLPEVKIRPPGSRIIDRRTLRKRRSKSWSLTMKKRRG
jgi:hypothetical protein